VQEGEEEEEEELALTLRRSQLFVPGNDEHKIRKSLELKCDSIIFDLEDAVPANEKSKARDLLARLLSELDWEGGNNNKKKMRKELCLRVNPINSPYFDSDVSKFNEEEKISSLVIPKAEGGGALGRAQGLSGGKNLIPLIETARGLLQIEDIVRTQGVVAVSFGAADFANSVGGSTKAYSGNVYVKTKIAVAARAYGVDPIDNVYFDLSNLEGFREEAIRSKELGFVGKQVVHPAQIEIANEVFSPSAEEVERAKRVVEAYEQASSLGAGAIRMNDELVDAVHYRSAKLLLERKSAIDSSTRA
jgi:citrate lyase subunit beta/citryl-CoA lyase